MSTQVCKKCGVEKSVSEFGKSGKRQLESGEWKQYYKTTCKQCTNKGRVRFDNVDPKVCNKCGVSKPLSEYAFEAHRDRYRGECKQCRYEQRLKHRAENPEVIERERERNRWRHNNIPEVAERNRRQSRESYEKHGEKRREKSREKYANNPEYAEKQRQYQKDRWANMDDDEKKASKLKTDQWIENNRERYDANNAKYYQENKEKIKAYAREYREQNPEHYKKLRKANYEKNQEKLVEDQRRIRKERRQYLEEYLGGKCVRCGATEKLEFDHIIPANKSYTIGSNITGFSLEELILEADKCQLLCRPCHIQKSKENGDFTGPKGLSPEVKAKRIKR